LFHFKKGLVMTKSQMVVISLLSAAGLAGAASGQAVFFSTNGPDLRMGAASREVTDSGVEIEAADDFLLGNDTRITGATVRGLIPAGAALTDVESVAVEIYRVFPLDSDTTRTARVPTRMNSPGDNAFQTRDASTGLAFTVTAVASAVTALNSVISGINPSPDQNTLGEGAVTGDEIEIHVSLAQPIDLPAGHYFFVPQVTMVLGGGDLPTRANFLWLSAPKPIVAPGTPFVGDLQAWIRSGRLDPDWLRIGADIVGGTPAPAFNMVLKLEGSGQPCRADFNNDGDVATDADIEDFFRCLAGNCCATCGTADFNDDGDSATDADIEAFFRVLAGGAC
jgi:hypothetical protein